MKRLILFLFVSIIIFSCKKDLDLLEQSKRHCRNNMEFFCIEPLGEFYFKGKLKDRDFCVSSDVEGYWMLNAIGVETTTSTENPVLSLDATPQSSSFVFGFHPPIFDNWNGISEDFMPSVRIITPFILDSIIYAGEEYFDRFIKKGDLVLRDRDTDKYSGFYFVIGWSCVMLPGYDHYYEEEPLRIPVVSEGFTPSAGPQNNAIFRITELEKTETSEGIVYDLTFEISCDLYYGSSSKDNTFYGRLEDGVFKTQVVLPY